MKNAIKLFALAVILFLPVKVLAVGDVTISTNSLTINKGSTASFSINANNAAGRVDISSANTSIATVSLSSAFLDSGLAPSVTITVTGRSVGTTTIKVNKTDVATFDNEEKTGSYIITVNVVEPTTSTNFTNQTTATTKPSTKTNTKNTNSNKTTDTNKNAGTDNTKVKKDYSFVELIVERVERTLNVNDYNTALEIVASLDAGDEKTAFINRLNTVKPKLLVEEQTTNCNCNEKDNRIWIMLCSLLLIIVIAENTYLVFKRSIDNR